MSYHPDAAVAWIVIHYSATAVDGRPITVADIDHMHRKRGFREVGYHYFVRRDGTVDKGRDLTQPGRFEQGAHSQGENAASIGICYEGGVTMARPTTGFDSRTPAQVAAMIGLVQTLLARFPRAVVRGHRDMPGAATQCPGFDAQAWWDDVAAVAAMSELRAAGRAVEPAARAPERVPAAPAPAPRGRLARYLATLLSSILGRTQR